MKSFVRFVVLISFTALLVAGQSMKTSKNSTPGQGGAKFEQLSDEFVKGSLALSPVKASYAGYHNHKDPKSGKTIDLDAQLDDVSPQGVAALEKFYSDWRGRFQSETPLGSLNAEDAADYRL